MSSTDKSRYQVKKLFEAEKSLYSISTQERQKRYIYFTQYTVNFTLHLVAKAFEKTSPAANKSNSFLGIGDYRIISNLFIVKSKGIYLL